MTILQVVKDVCANVGVAIPQSLFSGITSSRTMQEMLSTANEMAQRIAYEYRDWTRLKTYAVIHGNGVDTEFLLPANYKRMLLTGNVWLGAAPSGTLTSVAQSPLRFIPDTDEWMHRRASDTIESSGEWTLLGDNIIIFPAIALGAAAWYPYLDKNCVALSSGGSSDAFLNDADSFRLDERVLKLGMIWEWKKSKGASYAEDLSTYGDALGMVMGHDSPAPIILGSRPISTNARIAYPWPVPS